MIPSVIVVTINALLVVNGMNKDVAARSVLHLSESLDVIACVIKASRKHESLIGVLTAVGEAELVLSRDELGDLGEGVHARPLLDLGGDGAALKLQLSDVTVGDTEVRLRKDEPGAISDESHLVVDAIALEELEHSSGVHATDEDDIKVGLRGGHGGLLGAATSEVSLVNAGQAGSGSLLSDDLRSGL